MFYVKRGNFSDKNFRRKLGQIPLKKLRKTKEQFWGKNIVSGHSATKSNYGEKIQVSTDSLNWIQRKGRKVSLD